MARVRFGREADARANLGGDAKLNNSLTPFNTNWSVCFVKK